MSITINFPIDETELETRMDDGWTHVELFYANTPDVAYATTNVREALVADTYEYDLVWASGNGSQFFKVVYYNGSTNSELREARPFHGGSGVNLATIRQRVGKKLRDMVIAVTTSAGNTTTANINNVEVTRFADDHFNNWFINNTSDLSWSQVSDFVQSGGAFTVSPAMSGNGNAENIELTRRWTPTEYREAINTAILQVYPHLHAKILNTSLRTQAATAGENTMRYQYPGDILSLKKVEIEADPDVYTENERGYPWREVAFVPVQDGNTRYFELRRPLPSDRRLRLWGEAPLQLLYADTDWVEVGFPEVDLITFMACHNLFASLPNDAASSDIARYEQQAKYYLGMFGAYKENFGQGRMPQRVWNHDSQWNQRTLT